jgi:flagella basal body P-ring formation protein FlgA
MMRPFLLSLPLSVILLAQTMAGQAGSSCMSVSGEWITGRDLAAAVPELASLPAELTFGYSPTPGVQRVFLPSELQRLAARYGINAKIAKPACFGWTLHTLDRSTIIGALQTSLAGQNVELDIADQCRTPVPAGRVVFPIEGLTAESSYAALWNGYVSYAAGKRFTTWVKVRVTVHEKQMVATRSLRAGELIQASDIKISDYSGPLRRTPVIHRDLDVTGKIARSPIDAGAVLLETMLTWPQDVERQQLVTVHIHCGAAHIETQGIAMEAGYRGDIIKIRNPKTGRVFHAEINDQGVVTVVPGGDVGLVVDDKKS